jgi:transcriptional regulator with XRE-family HTH domain
MASSNRVRELRLAAGLSRAAVLRRAYLPTTTLGRIERGGKATPRVAVKLSAALGVPVVTLFPWLAHAHPVTTARYVRGLTQVDLARRAGLVVRTVGAIEAGQPCRRDTMRAVLEALDVESGPSAWVTFFPQGVPLIGDQRSAEPRVAFTG